MAIHKQQEQNCRRFSLRNFIFIYFTLQQNLFIYCDCLSCRIRSNSMGQSCFVLDQQRQERLCEVMFSAFDHESHISLLLVFCTEILTNVKNPQSIQRKLFSCVSQTSILKGKKRIGNIGDKQKLCQASLSWIISVNACSGLFLSFSCWSHETKKNLIIILP